jgi:hypothetical protein
MADLERGINQLTPSKVLPTMDCYNSANQIRLPGLIDRTDRRERLASPAPRALRLAIPFVET